MIMVHRDKRYHSTEFLIQMKNERRSNVFDTNSVTWVYYCDGKRHGRVPVMVLPDLVNLFGGEEYIRSLGYRKHWNIYLDEDTGEFTFGNRPAFAKSEYPEERQKAREMVVININILQRM